MRHEFTVAGVAIFVDVEDPNQIAGLAAARMRFNAALETSLEGDQALEDHPQFIATDAAYLEFVLSRWAEREGVVTEAAILETLNRALASYAANA